MKKLFISAVLTILFFSCNKEETMKTSNFSVNQLSVTDYGYYHNQAVSLYTREILHDSISNLRKHTPMEIVQDMANLMSAKFPEQFKSKDADLVNDMLGTYTTSNFDFLNFWNDRKRDLVSQGIITENLAHFYDDVFNNSRDYHDITSRINKFKDSNGLTDNELHSLNAFQSVINGSNTYWSNASYKDKKNPCTPRTILSDAIFSAIWAALPPVSILGGAACSLLTFYTDANC